MYPKTIRYFSYTILFFLIFTSHAFGQGKGTDTTVVITDTTNIEALFKKARDLYFNENYTQSRRICQKILEKKPTYYEVRTFLGRTYAWEKQYDKARTELSRVLIEKENDYEALNALFDVEFWTESYSVANDYLKVALGYYPTSTELLLKKAKLQIRILEKAEAAQTLRRILDLNPGNKEAIRLMNSLEGKKLRNSFQTSFLVDLYDKKKDPQQQFSAEFGRNFSFGSLILRGIFADKFKKQGLQYELETYSHFTRTTYANLLAGYSDVSIFPRQKYIAEIYQKLPAGFEVSFGLRYLKYTKGTKIYSGSLANYYKDYYFSVRTFVTPKDSIIRDQSVKKTSVTIIATMRIYFGDSDNYLGLKAGSGRSPDERAVALDVANYLPSYTGGLELQRHAFGRWLIKMDLTYAKENILKSNFTQRISTTVTMKTVF